jgi:hypothetical protein
MLTRRLSLVFGEVIVTDDIGEFKRMAREHDSRQPFIENELIEGINSYSCQKTRSGDLLRPA